MDKKRIFHFDGSEGKAKMMLEILNQYANAAYPVGSSDCAMASREALWAIAINIARNEQAEISRRQRPMLKAAVKWFYTESEYASPNDVMYGQLLSQFKK